MEQGIGLAQQDRILRPAEAYDLAAESYDGWSWQSFWRSTETPFFDTWVESHPTDRRRRILDVGCGTGFYLDRYGILFNESFGVDPSAGMLAKAAHKCLESRLLMGSVTSMAFFSPAVFDVIVCAKVLSHVPALADAISELSRVLAPGGMLLLSDVDVSDPCFATRLPTRTGEVHADIFRHDRAFVAELISGAGLEMVSSAIIAKDDTVHEGPLGVRKASGSVAGWMAMARKPLEQEDSDTYYPSLGRP